MTDELTPLSDEEIAEIERLLDEAVALLVDVEKYNHEFISPGWMARRAAFLAALADPPGSRDREEEAHA